jgi:hypothetical protein
MQSEKWYSSTKRHVRIQQQEVAHSLWDNVGGHGGLELSYQLHNNQQSLRSTEGLLLVGVLFVLHQACLYEEWWLPLLQTVTYATTMQPLCSLFGSKWWKMEDYQHLRLNNLYMTKVKSNEAKDDNCTDYRDPSSLRTVRWGQKCSTWIKEVEEGSLQMIPSLCSLIEPHCCGPLEANNSRLLKIQRGIINVLPYSTKILCHECRDFWSGWCLQHKFRWCNWVN